MQALKKFYFGKSKFIPFVSTWKTDNLSSGSSTATQVKLPLVSTGSYNFVVEWGDGTQSTITAWNQAQATKTYTVAGTYQITIKGKCIGWVFNNNGDILKILSVQQWGSLSLGTNQGNYFYGCANLNLSSVSDVLNLSGLSSINYCFRACSSITTINRINEWNLGNLSLTGLFYSCTSFNQDLGLLDVSKSSSFSEMFFGCNLFNNGGSSSINNWAINTSNGVSFFGMFQNAPAFNQPLGSWNTSRVTSMNRMFNGATSFNQNISNWNTSNVTDFSAMFWSATAFNQSIGLWNTSSAVNMESMFRSATAFNQNIGNWNVSKVLNFGNMFLSATAFNNGGSSDINNWVLSTTGAILMNTMFQSATSFNQTIGNWDTSRVTTMSSMFQSATAFNNGLANGVAGNMLWNLSSTTTVASMFQSATAFNQNLGALNLPVCANLSSMFYSATKFNNGGSSDINNWTLKTTGTITMASMFRQTNAFNQNLNNWNMLAVVSTANMFEASLFNNGLASGIGGNLTWSFTPSLTNISWMFSSNMNFNQNLNSFDTSGVINIFHIFNNATKFNNGLAPGVSGLMSWNTGSSTNMNGMFATANSFNQDISAWNVSNVTSMSQMFYFNTSFNQDISAWNVSNVTSMSQMFHFNTSFNQNIGGWNVSNVTNFVNFMGGKTPETFSAANLDAIYNGWSTRPVKTPITISFGAAKYTAAGAAGRAILTGAPNNWAIIDGGI